MKLQGNSLGLLITFWEENIMNNTFICTHCSTVHPISDRIIFNGQEVCEDCFEQETRICDRCGERIWAEDD